MCRCVCEFICMYRWRENDRERMIERETEGSFVERKKNRRLSLKKKKIKRRARDCGI